MGRWGPSIEHFESKIEDFELKRDAENDPFDPKWVILVIWLIRDGLLK